MSITALVLVLAAAYSIVAHEMKLRRLQAAADSCSAHVFTASHAENAADKLLGRQPKPVRDVLRKLFRYAVGVNAGGRTVSDELLAEIPRHNRLRALTFSHSPNFGDAQLAALTGLPGLDTLILHHTGVTDASASTLTEFKALRRIELDSCNISDPTLQALSTLTGIQHLGLENTAITPATLPLVANFPDLTYLDLKNTATDDSLAGSLTKLQRLRYLDLCNTLVTAELARALPPLPALNILVLTGTAVPPSMATELKRKLPALKSLELPATP